MWMKPTDMHRNAWGSTEIRITESLERLELSLKLKPKPDKPLSLKPAGSAKVSNLNLNRRQELYFLLYVIHYWPYAPQTNATLSHTPALPTGHRASTWHDLHRCWRSAESERNWTWSITLQNRQPQTQCCCELSVLGHVAECWQGCRLLLHFQKTKL